MMKRLATGLPDVWLLAPDAAQDARGYLLETYQQREFADLGIRESFVQDNQSGSRRGTLRGLHYQLRRPQAKLCRVVAGEVLDVVVDIRRGSPTFGKHTATILSAENRRQIYIPAGFAHGFLVLSEWADFFYKCSDYYDAGDQRGVAWDDPALEIEWNLAARGIATPLLSEKDQRQLRLHDLPAEVLPVFKG